MKRPPVPNEPTEAQVKAIARTLRTPRQQWFRWTDKTFWEEYRSHEIMVSHGVYCGGITLRGLSRGYKGYLWTMTDVPFFQMQRESTLTKI